MTKTIVIGACHQDDESIEFRHYLDASLEQSSAFVQSPSKYKYVELICKKYHGGMMDLMFAYNDPSNRSVGTLHLGYWNNGTVK